MFRQLVKLAIRPAVVSGYLTPHVLCRAIATTPILKKKEDDNNTVNSKYQTAYSRAKLPQAEKRLGFIIQDFEREGIPIGEMLSEAQLESTGLSDEQIKKTKEKVFDNIVECIEVKGYPTESNKNFNETSVPDVVLFTILPILTAFRYEVRRNIYLQRDREIIAEDKKMGGFQEFVGIDIVGPGQRKFVFIIEATNSLVGQAKRKCLLALKDIGDNNCGGIVYGFVTTAEQWQVIRYDGTTFTQSHHFQVMFQGMKDRRDIWMKEGAVIVDCINMVLRSGGFAKK